MYDYSFLDVKVFRSQGYGGLYVGTCKVCSRKFQTTSMDNRHGTTNLKHMFRHHVRPNSREECTAGMTYYSVDYEKRKARENR